MRDDTRFPQAGLPPPPYPTDMAARNAAVPESRPESDVFPGLPEPDDTTGATRCRRLSGPTCRSGGRRYDVRLRCDLDAAQAARLGDRLVRALADGVGRIVLWVEGTRPPSAEAACLVNSLGRLVAREGRWQGVEMRGQGVGFRALFAAFRQGQAGLDAAPAREGRP
ncbi:hypothetical protein [Solidesulfovibrio sp.]|uniref:hypothetical protein n=1 Tax=Solidesulfovibrio sp. TaxID=2910990 RepID=UPI0026233330|nr:hypothetical protein [Solidesulfovibrio sp.]